MEDKALREGGVAEPAEKAGGSRGRALVRPPTAPSLPLVGNALGLSLDPLSFQSRLHARLGPVFSARLFGRSLIFVDTAHDVRLGEQFFGATEDELDVIGAYRGLLGRLLGEDLFVPIEPELRASLTGRYARRRLPGSVKASLAHFQAQVEYSPTIDLERTCSDMVLRLLIEFLMGGEFSEDEKSRLCDAFDLIENDYSVLGMLSPIATPAFCRRVKATQSARELVLTAIHRRLGRSDPTDDLLQHLLTRGRVSAGGPLDGETIETTCLQIVGMVFAGHTNTAMTLALCLTELVKRSDLMTRVRQEVLRGFAGGTAAQPPSIVYRVISECVRLHSLGSCWRRAVCDQELGGFQILDGQYVGTSLGRINLDPIRFEAPTNFDVDRGLPPSGKRRENPSLHVDPIAAAGFGAGRHICPGRSLAQSMLAGLLSTLVQKYDWTLESQPAGWYPLLFPGVARPIGSSRMRVTQIEPGG